MTSNNVGKDTSPLVAARNLYTSNRGEAAPIRKTNHLISSAQRIRTALIMNRYDRFASFFQLFSHLGLFMHQLTHHTPTRSVIYGNKKTFYISLESFHVFLIRHCFL